MRSSALAWSRSTVAHTARPKVGQDARFSLRYLNIPRDDHWHRSCAATDIVSAQPLTNACASTDVSAALNSRRSHGFRRAPRTPTSSTGEDTDEWPAITYTKFIAP